MNRLALVLVIAASCGLEDVQPLGVPFAHADLRDRERVTFAVLADIGTGSATQYEVAASLHDVCAHEACDFVLVAGDNIYPSGIDGVDDPDLGPKFEEPYAALGDKDFWLVPGNHDRDGSVQAQVDYTAHSRRWRMPDAHYAVPDLPPWLRVYGFDTTADLTRQIGRARRTLCDDAPGFRFAFGHHPMFSHGKHGGSASVWLALGPLLRDCGVSAYFSGHDHHQELITHGALAQVIQGAGAEVRSVDTVTAQGALAQVFAKSELGFAIVRANPTSADMRFYDAHSNVLFSWEIGNRGTRDQFSQHLRRY